MKRVATLRVCASCEWVFKLQPVDTGCPKCQFGHYGARFVYGRRAYRYAVTQKPWYEKKMAALSAALSREIAESRPAAPLFRMPPGWNPAQDSDSGGFYG